MGICVPDASVILKWVLPSRNEPFAGAAQALRDAFTAGDLELVVPTLWLFEVGNTLTRKYPQQADELLGTLESLQIPEAQPTPEWRSIAIRLAVQHQATFYDASYHALAILRNGVFVTGDKKYLDRALRTAREAFRRLDGYQMTTAYPKAVPQLNRQVASQRETGASNFPATIRSGCQPNSNWSYRRQIAAHIGCPEF